MSGPMSLYPESCRQPTHRRAPRAHRSQGALVVVAIRGRNCVPPSTNLHRAQKASPEMYVLKHACSINVFEMSSNQGRG